MSGEIALIVAAYLVGALPVAVAIGRLKGIDIRAVGSGNTGTTNVWRTLGPRFGSVILAFDVLKGFVPTLVGVTAFDVRTGILAGAAAALGHTFPVFTRFRGGKGVATSAGVALAVTPVVCICLLLFFIAVLYLTRYVSLASISLAILYAPLVYLTDGRTAVVVFAVIAGAGVLIKHRGNVRRLLAGTERRTQSFGRGATNA